MFKTNFICEPRVKLNMPRLKTAIAKFRTVSHRLQIEIGRQHKIIVEDRLCKLCGQRNLVSIECEFHVLLECEAYSDLRSIYLANVEKTVFDFINIMKTNIEHDIVNLANYIYNMFNLRDTLLGNI